MRASHFIAFNTFFAAAFLTQGCSHAPQTPGEPIPPPPADASVSFSGKKVAYSVGAPCEQLYLAKKDGSDAKKISSDVKGRAADPAFLPDDDRILFTGNYAIEDFCPSEQTATRIYTIKTDGTDVLPLEPGAPRAYNGQATVCKDGSVVFVSDRDGDLELYRGQLDNMGVMPEVKRITQLKGVEKNPAFSADCKRITWQHEMQTWTAYADGSHAFEITENEASNRFKSVVETLSAKDMDGRGPGTPGLAKAEEFVAAQFKEIGLKPYAPAFKDFFQPIEMVIGKDRRVVRAHNVVGAWGKACGRGAPVVIGAHLDHLGTGGPESLEAKRGDIHPGADDNASGIAGMLEAARIIVADKKSQWGCFVFAAFTGEEVSVTGSSGFVDRLKASKIKPKAMLNLDMVGRLEDNHLIVFGSDSAQEWNAIIGPVCEARNLKCDGGGDGYGPSDHMPFYMAGTPVLHFFTGPHEDYHRVSDTADKVHFAGGVTVAQTVAAIALKAASPNQPLKYLKPSSTPTMGVLAGNGERRGNGAYLGTIPDYSKLSSPTGPAGGGEPQGGVRLGGVRTGSPAEKAGVIAGDVLLGIGPAPAPGAPSPELKNIRTLEDFMNILIGLKPDDDVVLQIRRDEKLLQLQAKVGKRE